MLFQDQEGLQIQKGFQRLEAFSVEGQFENGLSLLTQAGKLRLESYAPGIMRMRLGPEPATDYGLLVAEPNPQPFSIEQTLTGFQLQAGEFRLELLNGPLRMRLWRNEGLLLESATDGTITGELRLAPFAQGNQEWQLTFALDSSEAIYGLGEKFTALNRRGQLISSWNIDATTVNSELSYKNLPFAWSPQGWGFFVHTPAKVTHGVGYPQWSHRSYVLKVHDPSLDLFFIIGDSPAEILEKYTHLTGRAPCVPRWSYGAWIAHAYYRTAEETLEVVRALRTRQIPCDVILLDGRAWHKMETRFDFKWDLDRYPDPGAFLEELCANNMRLCLWEYPYISARNPLFNELAAKGYLLKTPEGAPYIHRWFPDPFDSVWPHLMPSGIIDFTNPEAYAWFRDQHQQLFQMGVAVMKPDYGEAIPDNVVAYNGDHGRRLHNVYAVLYNRCSFEASAAFRNGEPGLVWGRAGWIGSQRYPIQWGGDPQCDWEGLAASIRGGLSWGMSGGAYYTHDIGGFAIGTPAPELYIRWMQAGVMTSHTRFHGIGPREPWVYGGEAEQIVKDWLAWRYRLIPYLEACALDANQTGMPFMRAMPLAYHDQPLSWNFDNQYMLGNALFVAPVLVPGGKVQFYLPSGSWFDISAIQTALGEEIPGGQLINRSMPLDQIPIYGRAGTMLPLGPTAQHTSELPPSPGLTELWVFDLPVQDLILPGLAIRVRRSDNAAEVSGVPEEVSIRTFGQITASRRGDILEIKRNG